MRHPLMRMISVMTLCIFSVTTIAWSAPDTVYRIKVQDAHGKVKQRYKGDSEKTIIHIQDAHSSAAAQMNIAEIINGLVSGGTTDLIGVEGAEGVIDYAGCRSFPVTEARDHAAEAYLREGRFTGAEYGSVTSDTAYRLFGVEKMDLLKKNFNTFYATTLQRGDVLDYLDEIEAALQDLKTPLFSDALQTFDAVATQYEQGTVDLLTYLPTVYEAMVSHGVEILEYAQLTECKEVISLEHSLDFDRARKEQTELLDIVETANGKKDLSGSTENEKAQYISYQAEQLGVAVETQYRAFSKLVKYHTVFARLDFERLMREVGKVTYVLRMQLAGTPDAKALVQHWQRLQIVKRVLTLEAERREVAYFNAHKEKFAFSEFTGFIEWVSPRYGMPVSLPEQNTDAVQTVMELADQFYADAAKRDQVMLNNLLAQMKQEGNDTAVLLSGGFHSPGILKALKQQGINYVTVTPNIASIVPDLPYVERMTGQVFDLSPQLTSHINLLYDTLASTTDIQNGFFEKAFSSLSVLCQENPQKRAQLKKAFLGSYSGIFPSWMKGKFSHNKESVWNAFEAVISEKEVDGNVLAYVQEQLVSADEDAYLLFKSVLMDFYSAENKAGETTGQVGAEKVSSMILTTLVTGQDTEGKSAKKGKKSGRNDFGYSDIKRQWDAELSDFFGDQVSYEDFIDLFAVLENPDLSVEFQTLKMDADMGRVRVEGSVNFKGKKAYIFFGFFEKTPQGGLRFQLAHIEMPEEVLPEVRVEAKKTKYAAGFIRRLEALLAMHSSDLDTAAQNETIITLEAGKYLGKYVWAPHGFMFSDEEDQEEILEFLGDEFVDEWVHDCAYDLGDVNPAAVEKLKEDIQEIIAQGIITQPHEIIRLKVFVDESAQPGEELVLQYPGSLVSEGREVLSPGENGGSSFGKWCLLSGIEWNGVYHVYPEPGSQAQQKAYAAGRAYRGDAVDARSDVGSNIRAFDLQDQDVTVRNIITAAQADGAVTVVTRDATSSDPITRFVRDTLLAHNRSLEEPEAPLQAIKLVRGDAALFDTGLQLGYGHESMGGVVFGEEFVSFLSVHAETEKARAVFLSLVGHEYRDLIRGDTGHEDDIDQETWADVQSLWMEYLQQYNASEGKSAAEMTAEDWANVQGALWRDSLEVDTLEAVAGAITDAKALVENAERQLTIYVEESVANQKTFAYYGKLITEFGFALEVISADEIASIGEESVVFASQETAKASNKDHVVGFNPNSPAVWALFVPMLIALAEVMTDEGKTVKGWVQTFFEETGTGFTVKGKMKTLLGAALREQIGQKMAKISA